MFILGVAVQAEIATLGLAPTPTPTTDATSLNSYPSMVIRFTDFAIPFFPLSSSLLAKGDNAMFLAQARGGDALWKIMYDYIRLEAPVPNFLPRRFDKRMFVFSSQKY